MDNSPNNAQSLSAENKLHLHPSAAFARLEEILFLRLQPWSDFNGTSRRQLEPEPYTDADLKACIVDLEENEVARALVRACIHGDLSIAKSIWATRGPFPIEHEHAQYHEAINGTAVRQGTSARHVLTNAKSINEVGELMEWMPTVGLGFMVGVGSEHAILLESSELEQPIKMLAWNSKFTGELPSLAGGVVTNPELLLALQEKIKTSAYPTAYGDVLCWVPRGEVESFGDHLSPFEVHHGLSLKRKPDGQPVIHKTFPFSKCGADLMEQIGKRSVLMGSTIAHPGAWDFERLEMRVSPKSGISDFRSSMVMGYQGSTDIQHGFGHKPGHVLCRTSVDFLSQFDIGPICQVSHARAEQFTRNHFPLDIIALEADRESNFYGTCIRPDGGLAIGNGAGVSTVQALYRSLGDASPVKDHVRKALPRALVDFLINFHCKVNVDVESMLALNQAYGMDNTKIGMVLDDQKLQTLHNAGFRFSDETTACLPQRQAPLSGRTLTYERESSDFTDVFMDLSSEIVLLTGGPDDAINEKVLDDAYHNAMRMNLWPSETPKPESVLDALIQASRKKKWGDTNHEKALRAYIDIQGVEACANVAKSTSHWTFLRRQFGHAAVDPFMKLTTGKVRGRLLEDDLGL